MSFERACKELGVTISAKTVRRYCAGLKPDDEYPIKMLFNPKTEQHLVRYILQHSDHGQPYTRAGVDYVAEALVRGELKKIQAMHSATRKEKRIAARKELLERALRVSHRSISHIVIAN